MPEIQAAATDSWQEAADIQAAATDAWQDATDVQSVGSPFTPEGGSGGTVIVPGSLEALNDIAPATTYSVSNTLAVIDYRDDSVLPVEAVSMTLQEGSAHWTLTASGPGALAAAIKAGEQPAVVEVRLNSDVWRFVVDQVDQPLGFGSSSTSLRGTSLASLAGSPHQVARTWLADAVTTAAQVATVAQTYTGLEVDWRLTDWLIPAGAWSYTGEPFGVVLQMAAAAGAEVEAHPSEMSVMVRPTYGVLPNLWATTRPDWQIAWLAVEGASQARADKPSYDAVVLTGQQAGDVLVARLEGTSGANQAPLISDPLLTDVAAMQQRAVSLLAGYGKQTRETRTLQVHGRVIRRGELVRCVDPDETWAGVVRSVSVSASLGQARQTVTMERHTAFTLGTVAPDPIPAPPGDPHWPNVVLYVPGQDFNDVSSFARVGSHTAGVVVDTDTQLFGLDTLRAVEEYGARNQFSPSYDFALQLVYTFEFFIRYDVTPYAGGSFLLGSNGLRYAYIGSGGTIGFVGWGPTAGVGPVPMGEWVHVAIARDADGTLRSFMGGALVGTYSSTAVSPDSAGFGMFNIYARGDIPGFLGNLAHLRWTQGVCRYVEPFSPPAGPFPTGA